MALSTFLTAGSVIALAFVHIPPLIIFNSVFAAFFASIAYTSIYTYTPEVFETRVRGTATGTASALGRLYVFNIENGYCSNVCVDLELLRLFWERFCFQFNPISR